MELNERIREALDLKGWTQQDLADATGQSIKSVNDWVAGRARPRRLATIEKILGVSLREDPQLPEDPTIAPISQASDAELVAEIEGRIAKLRAALARAQRVAAEHALATALRPGEGIEHEQIIGWLRDPSSDPVVIEELGHLKTERLAKSVRTEAERAIVTRRAETLREQLDTLPPPMDRGTGTR